MGADLKVKAISFPRSPGTDSRLQLATNRGASRNASLIFPCDAASGQQPTPERRSMVPVKGLEPPT